ncbi:MAG: exodeoxyribonuclease III [Rhodospirillales bacterium]|nr:exodeoxyribonuclease III [Rhodospirillales bacterium]
MTRIATWNVNGSRARLPRIVEWLTEFTPDIALLQEIKAQDETFPREAIEDLGYNVAVRGQKSFNGVAILSKQPIEDVITDLPGDGTMLGGIPAPDGGEEEQARYIEAFIGDIRVASIYLPNGNPAPGDKYDYKLAWMERLHDHAQQLLTQDEAVVLGGDYNVIPEDEDCHDPVAWKDDALCLPETRAKFRAMMYLGYTDAYRALNTAPNQYSFWDYQRGAWQKDFGVRIDHLLLSPQATDRLVASGIDRNPRGKEKASDHTPVWCELGPPRTP